MTFVGSTSTDNSGHFEWQGHLSSTYTSVSWTRINIGSTSELSIMLTPICHIDYLPITMKP